MQWIKTFLPAVITAAVCCISSCNKSKTSTLKIQLHPQYGTRNFALGAYNTDPSGKYVQFNNFQFYLSHIYLTGANNTKVKVTDISFFDLSNPATLTLTVPNVEGSFSGITFYCGVDSFMDTISPISTTGPSGLEQGAPYMFWSMLLYQFENVGGKWDTMQVANMRNALLYNVGGFTCLYKQVSLASSFVVNPGATVTKTLNLDIEKLFYNGSTQTLNIATQGYTSCDTVAANGGSPSQLVIAQQFATNFAGAFSLQ